MIIGTGIDLVEVPDMERRLARKTILGVFSEYEQRRADARPKHRAQIYAAHWAAKEAFTKAIGTGIPTGWHRKLIEIEVVYEKSGKPGYRIGPFFQKHLPEGAQLHVSMTHLGTIACAFAILELPDA
jgi:holo-[acyl-carrier protein] synthase